MPKNEIPPQETINAIFENAAAEEKIELDFIQIKISELITVRLYLHGNEMRDFWRDFMTVLKKRRKTKETAGQKYAYNLLAKAFYAKKRKSEGGKNKNQQHTTPTNEDLFK